MDSKEKIGNIIDDFEKELWSNIKKEILSAVKWEAWNYTEEYIAFVLSPIVNLAKNDLKKEFKVEGEPVPEVVVIERD